MGKAAAASRGHPPPVHLACVHDLPLHITPTAHLVPQSRQRRLHGWRQGGNAPSGATRRAPPSHRRSISLEQPALAADCRRPAPTSVASPARPRLSLSSSPLVHLTSKLRLRPSMCRRQLPVVLQGDAAKAQRVVSWQCRHGHRRCHPLLQEFQCHVHDFLNPREFDMIDHIGIALPYLYVLFADTAMVDACPYWNRECRFRCHNTICFPVSEGVDSDESNPKRVFPVQLLPRTSRGR